MNFNFSVNTEIAIASQALEKDNWGCWNLLNGQPEKVEVNLT
ncbi:hypothetical protein ACL6C3_19960 [Capilliphycus salinus ALCB114379]